MITTDAGFAFDGVQFDPEAGAYRFEYDQMTTTPSIAAVSALSQVLEADPTGLPPLGHAVDTDALDALLRASPGTDGELEVGFTFQGRSVTVKTGGVVTVSPTTEHAFDGTGPNDA